MPSLGWREDAELCLLRESLSCLTGLHAANDSNLHRDAGKALGNYFHQWFVDGAQEGYWSVALYWSFSFFPCSEIKINCAFFHEGRVDHKS